MIFLRYGSMPDFAAPITTPVREKISMITENNIKFAIVGSVFVPLLANLNLQGTGQEYNWIRLYRPH